MHRIIRLLSETNPIFQDRSDAKFYKTSEIKTLFSHIKIIIAENPQNYSIFLYRFCEFFQQNNRITNFFAKKLLAGHHPKMKSQPTVCVSNIF